MGFTLKLIICFVLLIDSVILYAVLVDSIEEFKCHPTNILFELAVKAIWLLIHVIVFIILFIYTVWII